MVSLNNIYSSLNVTQQIRIVVLKPGHADAPIECELKVINLSEGPAYQALSYTWGSYRKTEHIILNGQEAGVGENLWSALWHLREYDQLHSRPQEEIAPRCLWIDAICINQEDVSERNHQVGLMRQIYSGASEVVVWLGPSDDESDLGMNVLNKWFSSDDTWQKSPAHMLFLPREMRAVASLLAREYWKRIWIIQEVVVGLNLSIHCGLQRTPWVNIMSLQECVTLLPTNDCYRAILASKALALIPLKEKFQHRRGTELFELLQKFEDCQSSDPRDKVFALLGLARDCQNDEVAVDYSKAPFHLYHDIVHFYSSRDPTFGLVELSQRLQKMLGILPEVKQLEKQQSKLYRDEKHLADSLIKVHGEFRGQISRSFQLRAKVSPWVMLDWNSNVPLDLQFNYDVCTKSDIRHVVPIKNKILFANMYGRGGDEYVPHTTIAMTRKRDYNSYEFDYPCPDIHKLWKRKRFRLFKLGGNSRWIIAAPPQTKRNDMICSLYGDNLLVVLRKTHPEKWSVIGRAAILMRSGKETGKYYTPMKGDQYVWKQYLRETFKEDGGWPFLKRKPSDLNYYQIHEHDAIVLHVDAVTLLMLTA